MKTTFKFAAAGLVAAAFAHVPAFAQDVTGAGASFPAPLYSKWAADYNKATGAKINYQSVGSGAGLKQIEAKTVDFGASDMPLTDEELQGQGPDAVPHRHRRRGPRGQHPGHQARRAQAQRPGAGRHLPGQDHQVERPGDQGAERLAGAARRRHRPGAPRRRLGHHLPVHQLPDQGQRRVEEPRSATARPSTGPSAPAARATKASPPS